MKVAVFFAVGAFLALSACEPVKPLTDYRPVVDPARTNQAKFERDLVECRNLAIKVEADYKARQQKEMGQNMMVGIVAGALLGAAVGNSDYAAAGALYGGAAGAAAGDYTHDLVTYGPRRIVDRCMAERGHRILNDIGRG